MNENIDYEVESHYIEEWDKTIIQVWETDLETEKLLRLFMTYQCGKYDDDYINNDISVDMVQGRIDCIVSKL